MAHAGRVLQGGRRTLVRHAADGRGQGGRPQRLRVLGGNVRQSGFSHGRSCFAERRR
jgi:hypothetical protein